MGIEQKCCIKLTAYVASRKSIRHPIKGVEDLCRRCVNALMNSIGIVLIEIVRDELFA